MVRWQKVASFLCILFLLQGCQNKLVEPSLPLEDLSNQSAVNIDDSSKSSNIEKNEDKTYSTVDDARQLILTAFGSSVDSITPEVSIPLETLKSISFTPDPKNLKTKFVVQFQDNYAYPYCVYYFHHTLEDDVNIATDADFSFDTTAIYKASGFVKTLYEVDVSNASVRAYGYKNKVAIQFRLQDGSAFDVRMYYKDYEPVGCFYLTSDDDLSAWENMHNAKVFYESGSQS